MDCIACTPARRERTRSGGSSCSPPRPSISNQQSCPDPCRSPLTWDGHLARILMVLLLLVLTLKMVRSKCTRIEKGGERHAIIICRRSTFHGWSDIDTLQAQKAVQLPPQPGERRSSLLKAGRILVPDLLSPLVHELGATDAVSIIYFEEPCLKQKRNSPPCPAGLSLADNDR